MILRDIINTAYWDMGVVPAGSLPSEEFVEIGLNELNAMLRLFTSEGLILNAFAKATVTLITGQASYTVSDDITSNFVIPRPTTIHSAFIRVDNTDTNLDVYNTINRYDEYVSKNTQGMPGELYYHPTYLIGTIYLYPTPDTNYSLYLTYENISSVFTTDTILLPDEYEMMLSKNLSKFLMPKFGRNDLNIIQMAEQAKQTIMNNNSKLYLQESKFDRLITYPLCR